MRAVRAFVAAASLALVACSSKPAPATEIAHAHDGDLDAVVQIVSVRPSNSVTGKAWIAEDRMVMMVKRGNDLLKERRPRCSGAERTTFELRLDAKRSFVSYRCKPSEPWVVSHVAATAVHVDCEANGGTGAEPDLAPAKTFLERADVLVKCAVEDKYDDQSRDVRTLSLAIDVRGVSTPQRTAKLLLTMLDLFLAQDDDGWPHAVWTMELLQDVPSAAEKGALPHDVYLELQDRAAERLAHAKTVKEIAALASVAEGRTGFFREAAPSAMKVLLAAPASGLRDAAVSLVLGPLIETAPTFATKLACEALGAGLTSGTAGLVFSVYVTECPPIAKAVRALPSYSKKWFAERCAATQRDALSELPTQFLDDKWKRKVLGDSAFRANPHDLVSWDTGLLAAACRDERSSQFK